MADCGSAEQEMERAVENSEHRNGMAVTRAEGVEDDGS
jgi:hypothetical protein